MSARLGASTSVRSDVDQAPSTRAESIGGNMDRQIGQGHDRPTTRTQRRRCGAPRPAPARRRLAIATVIEAATENEAVKRKIFRKLCPTACRRGDHRDQHLVDLDHPAGRPATDRPSKFIGMHFMNPVPLMELVELIRGIATEEETFARARGGGRKLGKKAGQRRGLPGLHRQPHPAADDQRGGHTLYEGVGNGRGIDTGHEARRQPSDGSAELADFIGLSVRPWIGRGAMGVPWRHAPGRIQQMLEGYSRAGSGYDFATVIQCEGRRLKAAACARFVVAAAVVPYPMARPPPSRASCR